MGVRRYTSCGRLLEDTEPDIEAFFVHRNDHEKEIDKLKAQLWRYGKHLAVCPLWHKPNSECTCGWLAVRATLAPVERMSDDAFNAAIAPCHSQRRTEHG
jgi:hypothetical protein